MPHFFLVCDFAFLSQCIVKTLKNFIIEAVGFMDINIIYHLINSNKKFSVYPLKNYCRKWFGHFYLEFDNYQVARITLPNFTLSCKIILFGLEY